ncbi:MAG: hypothetical protein AB7F25_02775 [Deferribacterales bacterium]|jgi:hypothetical protein
MENYVIEKRVDGSVFITGTLSSDLEYLISDNQFSTVIDKDVIQKMLETAEFVTSKNLFEASFFHPVDSEFVDDGAEEFDENSYAVTGSGYVIVDKTTFQLKVSLAHNAEDLRSETINISEII